MADSQPSDDLLADAELEADAVHAAIVSLCKQHRLEPDTYYALMVLLEQTFGHLGQHGSVQFLIALETALGQFYLSDTPMANWPPAVAPVLELIVDGARMTADPSSILQWLDLQSVDHPDVPASDSD